MTLAPLLTIAILSGLPVDGSSSCPTPAAVEAQLADGSDPQGRRGALAERDGGLEVSLLAPNGEVLASRTLRVQDRCEVLAEAAAVMLRSWESEWVSRAPPAPGLPPRPRPRFAVGAELLGSTARFQGAPSYGFGARARLSGSGPGYLLAALGWASPRSVDFAGGAVVYQRLAPLFSLGVGGELRWGWATVGVEGSLGVARLSVAGEGFVNTREDSALDLGLGAGVQVRVAVPAFGAVEPYLGLRGVYWATRHVAEVTGLGSTALPQQEWLLALGVQVPLGGPPR